MATGKGRRMEDALWQRLVACEFRLSDGTRLQDQVAQTTALTGARAEAAIQVYRQFLWLCAQGQGVQVPSPAIDAVWHLHLLDTRAYASFCDQVIGRMIHHSPGRPAAAKDPAYPETYAALTRHFGPPEPGLWPSPRAQKHALWAGAIAVLSLALGYFVTPFGFWVCAVCVLYLVFRPVWPVKKGDSGGCSGGSGGDDGGCGGD